MTATSDASAALAPGPGALPQAPPAPVLDLASPADAYVFSDRAWWLDEALAGSPPDYAFGAEGVSVWAWKAHDGAERLIEATRGVDRAIFYAPGADEPFFIREADGRAFGYQAGDLAAVYDTDGTASPQADDYGGPAEAAGRLLERARMLKAYD
ncbi:MAG: hypothetical protein ACREEQ_09190, partial [Caulobacteraceae bacterium]